LEKYIKEAKQINTNISNALEQQNITSELLESLIKQVFFFFFKKKFNNNIINDYNMKIKRIGLLN
jgi:hypothetical protein